MKTIRLLYPDYVSGGLETYYFGANLLQHILPENKNQPLIKVAIAPPDGEEKAVVNGIFAEDEVLAGIRYAQKRSIQSNPTRLLPSAAIVSCHLPLLITFTVYTKIRELSGLMLIRIFQRQRMAIRTLMQWYSVSCWGMERHSFLNR